MTRTHKKKNSCVLPLLATVNLKLIGPFSNAILLDYYASI